MNIKDYIVNYFLRKTGDTSLNRDNILAFHYIDNQYLTPIEFKEMIIDFEQAFSIQFSEAELKNPEFGRVGNLIKIVERLTELSNFECA